MRNPLCNAIRKHVTPSAMLAVLAMLAVHSVVWIHLGCPASHEIDRSVCTVFTLVTRGRYFACPKGTLHPC